MKRLKYLATIIAGQSPESVDVLDFTSGMPFLQGNAEFGSRYPSPKLQCASSMKVAMPGDILVSVRAPVGALNMVDQKYGIGRGLAAVRPRGIDSRYLWWWLHTQIEELQAESTGSTFAAVSAADIANLQVPVEDSNLQKAIAVFLDRETSQIDELIGKQEQLIELLAEKRQAIITNAVTRGLDTSVHTKRLDIPGLRNIPVHWRISKLSWESIRIGDGLHGTPQYSDHGSIPFINGTNLLGGSIRITDSTRFVEEDQLSNADMSLTTSTVLMSINGTVGNCAVLGKQRVMLSKSAAYITCADGMKPQFLAYFLRSEYTKDYFQAASGGTTIANLSLATLRGTPIPVPPLEEQEQLVRFIENRLGKMGDLANKTNSALQLLRERRSALIAATVTGKMEVA